MTELFFRTVHIPLLAMLWLAGFAGVSGSVFQADAGLQFRKARPAARMAVWGEDRSHNPEGNAKHPPASISFWEETGSGESEVDSDGENPAATGLIQEFFSTPFRRPGLPGREKEYGPPPLTSRSLIILFRNLRI